MSVLATSTDLGALEILEIYVQYNGPRLLSCKNQVGKLFLALWVDEEEDADLWLYMLVSIDRLQAIRTGKVSLFKAFSEPENGFLYEVSCIHPYSEWHIKKVLVEELDPDCLPVEDAFLKCDPKSLPVLEPQKAIQNAILKAREIVNLRLEPLSNHPYEISSLSLGKILCAFQPLMDKLSTLVNTEQLRHKDLAKQSEFNVFATSPGSFQVELASSVFEANIFGNSLAGDAVEQLFRLIKIGNNSNELQNFMLQADKKIAIKYRHFLEALINSGTGLKIEWGSPTLTRGGCIETSLTSINEILEIIKKIDSLESKEYEIVGELFKVDTDSWKFGIREISTDFPYKGDILEQAKSSAGTATISRLYIASIIEIPEMKPAMSTIKLYYKLAALRPYEPNDIQLKLID